MISLLSTLLTAQADYLLALEQAANRVQVVRLAEYARDQALKEYLAAVSEGVARE